MVNLLKIRTIAKGKKISMRELATAVGITEAGLYGLMSKNSTKVETLEKIAIYLKIPVSTFFEEGKAMHVSGSNIAVVNNGNQSIGESQELEMLRKEIEECRKENELLRKIIDLYERGNKK